MAPLAAVTIFSADAKASPAPTEEQLSGARETFAAAVRDEDAALWTDALAKLRAVAAVKATPGVRYHIALCEENTGMLVEALADYTSADGQARAEGARDVLKLVGARIVDVTGRIPRLTVRVVPEIPGTAVTVDGKAFPDASGTAAIPENPGQHRVEVRATDRPGTATVVMLHERETAAIDLPLGELPSQQPPEVPPPPRSVPEVASLAVAPERPVALLAAAGGGFVVLAAVGVGAYVAAGSALSDGIRTCRQLATTAVGACDSEKNTVRAWDWAAAAAWAGAATAGTLAVVSWTRRADVGRSEVPSARIVVGPASVGVGGTF